MIRFFLALFFSCRAFAATLHFTNDAAVTGLSAGDTAFFWGNRTNGITVTSGVTYIATNGARFLAGSWTMANKPVSGACRNVVLDGLWIEATNNGLGLGFTNLVNAIDLNLDGALEIKNCIITNMLQRTSAHGENVSGQGIVVGGTMTNVLIHNNWIEMVGNAIILGSTVGYCTNVQIFSNRCERVSWGIFLNTGTLSYCEGFQIWANTVDRLNVWDTPNGTSTTTHQDGIYPNAQVGATYLVSAADGQGAVTNLVYPASGRTNFPVSGHPYYVYNPTSDTNNVGIFIGHNPIDPNWTNNLYGIVLGQTNVTANQAFITSTNIVTFYGTPGAPVTAQLNAPFGGTNLNLKVYRNKIGPTVGTNMSGAIFVAPDWAFGYPGIKIFNNLVVFATNNGAFNGAFNVTRGGVLANNTAICSNFSGFAVSPSGQNITNINNLFWGFRQFTTINVGSSGVPGGAPIGYGYSNTNVYFGLNEWALGQGGWPALQNTPWNFCVYLNPPFESGSMTNNPSIQADGSIPTNSAAAGVAVNLRAWGITEDFYGNPRPGAGTNFDIGAFNSGAFVSDGGGGEPGAPIAYRVRIRK